MHYPHNRIRYARGLARQLAVVARQEAGTLAADAVRLIRETGCSPAFAGRIAHARARAMNPETTHAHP